MIGMYNGWLRTCGRVPAHFQLTPGVSNMSDLITKLRKTTGCKHIIAPRLIAGLPLLGIGMMHITGMQPMRPILEGASIPLPGLNAMVAPVVEIVAGLILLSGAFTRIGAAMAMGTMTVALYTHLKFVPTDACEWGDEPSIVMPLAVFACAAYVLWRGGGAWSVDQRAISFPSNA